MGPPDIIIVLLFLLFGAFVAGIGFLAVFLITKASRKKFSAKTMLLIMGIFAVLFIFTTIWVRDTKDNVSVQIFGHEPYEGAEFSYGFPLVFMNIFRPYDASVQYLYVFPTGFQFESFLIDFILWLAVSTVLVLAVQRFRLRRTISDRNP